MGVNAWYGCRRDLRDARDFLMAARSVTVPNAVDLRYFCPPVMDQGEIGSCVWNALTAAARYHIIRRGTTYDFEMSRLQGYYETRALEGTVASDGGCEIRNAIKVLAKKGIGHEDLWPYDTSKFAEHPPTESYDDAVQYKALKYERVPVSTLAVKQSLAAGSPVIIGISIYESFESDVVSHSGFVPMPRDGEGMIGGHAMLVVGYGGGTFIVRNSWGEDWADKGYCYIQEPYVGSTKYGADFWRLSIFGSDAEMAAGRA